jgi:hypothetical protein
MKSAGEETKKKLRQYGFIYADVRLGDEELVLYAELAWQEIYDLEYEQAFGGWRGIHLDEESDHVNVTFENAYGGPPLMVTISRKTREKRLGYPPEDYVLKENENISKLMKAMGMPEEKAEMYKSMHIMKTGEQP